MLRGGSMSKSRRDFLTQASLGLIGAAVASSSGAEAHANELAQEPTQLPPGAPPAFGTGPAVGPDVSPATFAEAEKLVQINLSTADRALAAETWRVNLASVYERRSGPRTIALESTLAPFSRCHAVLPGQTADQTQKLLDSHPRLTRLSTFISPEEMTIDPTFTMNSSLPDVPVN